MINSKKGFGAGAVIVVIALILIVGAYLYYAPKQEVVAPVDETPATTDTDTIVSTSTGLMEDGTLPAITATSTVSSTSTKVTSTTTTVTNKTTATSTVR